MYKTDSATKQYWHSLYTSTIFMCQLRPARRSQQLVSATSDDTASMIKEGVMQVPGWHSQLPTAHTHGKKSMWAREMYAVAEGPASWLLLFKLPNYSVLQCIACFHECRCMSDGVFIQFVCQVLKFLESRLRSARDLCLYCPWGTKKAFIKACA